MRPAVIARAQLRAGQKRAEAAAVDKEIALDQAAVSQFQRRHIPGRAFAPDLG